MNPYAFPHKGLRNAISQLVMTAGSANSSDADSLTKLKALAEEVFSILEHHSHSEESVTLPALEAKVVGSTVANVEEHKELEEEIEKLRNHLKGMDVDSGPDKFSEFYAAISGFNSRYLNHMEMEETKMNTLIWSNFTNEELMGQHGQIMSKMSPETTSMMLKYIVPALNHAERSVIMGGLKANAPAPFYESVMDVLSGIMATNDYQKMTAAIS